MSSSLPIIGCPLFIWREKIVPTLGILLIDLVGLKTDGVIIGNDGFDAETIVHFAVGARAEVLQAPEGWSA